MTRQLLERLEPRLLFTTYEVNTLRDSADDLATGDGLLSFREAIEAANTDAAVADAAAGSGADTIIFAASLRRGTLHLAAGELLISSALTIDGGDRRLTLDANAASRIFTVQTAEAVRVAKLTLANGRADEAGAMRLAGGGLVAIDRLTIRNSLAVSLLGGGAIENIDSEMIVTRSKFFNNTAGDNLSGGAILTQSLLGSTISDARFRGNSAGTGGGAVANEGILEINRSIFRGNAVEGSFATGGGAIVSTYDLTLRNSLIEHNRVTGYGAGGGVYLAGGNIIATTVAGNVATLGSGGGIYLGDGQLYMARSEVLGNRAGGLGGGLLAGTSGSNWVSINDSLIAYNYAHTGGGGAYFSGGDVGITRTVITRNGVAGPLDTVFRFRRGVGGGIRAVGSTLHLRASEVTDNFCRGDGGGVFNQANRNPVANTSFGGTLEVFNSTIEGNRSNHNGGGIYNDGVLRLGGTVIRHNEARRGGGIFSEGALIDAVARNVLSDNEPDDIVGRLS